MKNKRSLAVFDCETDPFQYGRRPEVFAIGYLCADEYRRFWGENCVNEFIQFLREARPSYLFAHNGGKFDFYFLLEHLENPFKVINGRIVSCKLGKHILRDSYAIIPIPLREFEKDTIDYEKMERENREEHKAEILSYLRSDCENLYKLVDAFIQRFGTKLTIASTAITELQKFHSFERQKEAHDVKFRQFYFGGRVQCLETGILKPSPGKQWQVWDVNSMYPFCMASYSHPTGREYICTTDLDFALATERPFFIEFDGFSNGAFPRRENEGLTFPVGRGTWSATSHELRTALELGACTVEAIHSIYLCATTIKFPNFVQHWSDQKISARKNGDRIAEIFAKLILNSAYGKFGANPANYFDWYFYQEGEFWPGAEWEPYLDYGWLQILRRPAVNAASAYYDVATAASITGAARSVLMRALRSAQRPVYCDTDSIICEGLPLRQDATALGAWKLEATGNVLAVVGKKLYALRSRGRDVKIAAKGISANGKILLDMAKGVPYISRRDSPTFQKDGSVKFVSRTVGMKG